MEYTLFNAKSEKLGIEKSYIYNLAIGEYDGKMRRKTEVALEAISLDIQAAGFDIRDFKISSKVVNSRYVSRNRDEIALIEPVAIGEHVKVPTKIGYTGYDRVTTLGFRKGYYQAKTKLDKATSGENVPRNSKWRDIDKCKN